MGRRSVFTDEIAQRIINGLMDGMSLVKVCELPGIPTRRTVLNWWESRPDFYARCTRAREMQADLMDDKIRDLIESVTPESAPADRVKLAALQWRAAKLAPKKYGERVTNEMVGADGGPIQHEDVSARDVISGRLADIAARSAEPETKH